MININAVLNNRPYAFASVKGGEAHPTINGIVRFYNTPVGILISTQVSGLPTQNKKCTSPVFGFHIHEGEACTGNESDEFANTKMHYNPQNCPHPYHTGDMPPLFGNNGFAVSVFLTDRFTWKEIIGKTVIIHSKADDFTSQPSGNAGTKIACGKIQLNRK